MIEGVTPFPEEFARRYRDADYWEDRPLRMVFGEVFHRYASRVALVDGDETITYGELDERSTRLACHLLDLGFVRRDRVVVQLPNTAMFAYLYFALQKIGAIPVLCPPSHGRAEVHRFVSISDAVACAIPFRHNGFSRVDMAREIAAETPALRSVLVQGADGAELPREFFALEDMLEDEPMTGADGLRAFDIDPDDPAVFLISGDSAGVPKLIPRSHNDYACTSRLAVPVCDVRPDDVLLPALPIEHNLPLACPGLQGFLMAGARVVLTTSAEPENVFRLVQRHRVTHIHLVPALLIRWLNDPHLTEYDLSSVRVVQSGGQRLQPEIRDRAEKLVPTATVQENFGMAEGLVMFVRLDDPEDVRRETCGRPVCPDDEVRLVDDDGAEVPPGETGELCVRGPYTPRGYFRAPEHNARAFTPDGFYRSGDLMRRHPSGNYVVEGRKRDLIHRGGEKISAEEVENLVLAHPAVLNVGCVPVPDPMLGERMCACVALHEGAELTLRQLGDFLTGLGIAEHKLPERLAVFDRLPLSPIGKVSKKDLVDRLAGADHER